jgi:hypothetical protein
LNSNSKLLSNVRVATWWAADRHAFAHEELVLFIVMHIEETLVIDLFSSSEAGGQGLASLDGTRTKTGHGKKGSGWRAKQDVKQMPSGGKN